MRPPSNLWVLCLSLSACNAARPPHSGPGAEAPPQATTPASSRSEQATLEGLKSATDALALWRVAIEGGAPIDDGALLDLRASRQLLEREIEVLLASVEARDAALRPDPAWQARREVARIRAARIALPWIDDIRATGEGATDRRATALEQMRATLLAALGSPSPPVVEGEARAESFDEDRIRLLAALMTLQSTGDVLEDKAPFRALVLPIAQEANGLLMVFALVALLQLEPRPEDLALVHAAWDRDPQALDNDVLLLLKGFGGGRLQGRSEEIALACIEHVDSRRVNQQLHGLSSARVGPRLEARVLELSRDPDPGIRHGALYFGLSTFQDKSGAVVDALIEALSDKDPNNWNRALWGLGHGVPPHLQPLVVDSLVDFHNRHTDERVRETCATLVRRYGGSTAEEQLAR